MASVLGKRKMRTQNTKSTLSKEEAQAKLAQLFEAEFKPLFPKANSTPTLETENEVDEENEESSEAESWGGISENEDSDSGSESATPPTEVVEVVAHTDAYSTITKTLDKREARAWLSSRPPTLISSTDASSSTKKKGKPTEDEEDAPSLLKNDLELQRLLSESHLFSAAAAKTGDASTEHVGRNRHLATDLRLSALGSKTSIYKQAKMPMSIRKGIESTAADREAKRRREARENGIILEKPGAGKKTSTQRRKGPSRDIDAPAVGRMSNGMLKLSKQDIASIEASGARRGGPTKKRRR
ncbi:hypothetical protein GGS20DRAFT_281231 [Poronia punctata]|nr:hypothetical protein GGS20DRAFT_281231 [Poronia punctata]